MNMNDAILADPPSIDRRPDGYAQGCAWCVVLGFGLLVAVMAALLTGWGR